MKLKIYNLKNLEPLISETKINTLLLFKLIITNRYITHKLSV